MVRLHGVQLPEEREEMGRVNAGLSAMVAVTLTLALAIPGVHENSTTVIAGEAFLAAVWALIAARFVTWQTAPGWVAHASATGGLMTAAVGMWASAGHLTPGRFYLVIIVVATAYFLTPREAWWYPFGAFLVHASPVLYEASARSGEFLTELLIVAPVYVMLSVLILRAKQQLVELRGAAHRQARQDPLTGLANRRALL
jgi:hypothetical protein